MTRPQGKAGSVTIEVTKVTNTEMIGIAKDIRYQVFVVGQGVPEEEEIDCFEAESFHFIAMVNSEPCGAARWRFTQHGIKLERFAVLENYRGLGVGSALVQAVLDDIAANTTSIGKTLYLHAQLDAMNLYAKFDFKVVGELFQECDIDHYKMVRPPLFPL